MNADVKTELAIRNEPMAVVLTDRQLQMIANTPFVPQAFRGKVPEILACVATGRALGLADMTSLRGINVINGKATFSAELMDAVVRAHGHSITGTVTDTAATVRGKRADNGDAMEATFTIEMAERAGLLSSPAWKKHPDDMLWARAVSKLCRRLFADCFAGATYVPEEVTADEVMDMPVEEVPASEPELASAEDLERLKQAWKASGITALDLREIIYSVAGVESSMAIPADKVDAIIAALPEQTGAAA